MKDPAEFHFHGICRRAFVVVWILILSMMASPCAQAHHGRDFILLQDSAIPQPLSGVAIASYQWTRDRGSDAFSTEPGFFIGLAPALGFGLTAGFSDEDKGWNYTGITPQLVISLLGPVGERNVRMGFWTGYEFAERQSQSHDSGNTGGVPAHTHNTGSGPDAGGSVAPHSHSTSGHDHGSHSHGGGIHRHGESGWYSRLIVEADLFAQTRAVLNLVSFVSGDGGRPGFGYAVGLRHEFTHDFSVGMEAIGDFRSYGSSHEVLLTTMVGLPRHLALRLGVGGGLTKSSSDFTLSSSILWRF